MAGEARELARARSSALSEMRSDLVGAGRRCWYNKTLSGDERHYPYLTVYER